MKPRVSVVVTARDEGEAIIAALRRISEAVSLPCEVLVVCDSADDADGAVGREVRGRRRPGSPGAQ